MKKKLKTKLKIVAFIVLVALTLYILFKNADLKNIGKILADLRIGYIYEGIGLLFLYMFLEVIMLKDLLATIHKGANWLLAFKTMAVGQYYSLITPMATGGQPVQLYVMAKEDISLSKGSAVLVNKFLFFQVGVTIYSLVLFGIKIRDFSSIISNAMSFVIIGLSVNTIGLWVLGLMLYNPEKLKGIVHVIIKFLHRFKLLKNAEERMLAFENSILEYNKSIKMILEDKRLILRCIIFTFIQLTAYFGITYSVYKAFNLSGNGFWDIIALQSFLYMAVTFIPTPGAVGVSEIGFHIILGTIFSGVLVYAILIWRGITFYFNLIFSGILTLIFTLMDKKKEGS